MKLSKAIRKGCELFPRQARNEYIRDTRTACALATAYAAAVGLDKAWDDLCGERYYADEKQDTIVEYFCDKNGWDLREIPTIPNPALIGRRDDDVFDAILDMNDKLKWDRSRIAHYLERHGF